MSRLLTTSGLFDDLKARLADGMPVFGTCAGMILCATEVLDGRPDQRSFGVIDITVRRNGYGRQVDSFEADIDVDGLDDRSTPCSSAPRWSNASVPTSRCSPATRASPSSPEGDVVPWRRSIPNSPMTPGCTNCSSSTCRRPTDVT